MNNLFNKTKLGGLEVNNQFMRSGTWTELASDEGFVTNELMAAYKPLAEGNVGLVIAGYARVNQLERANNNMISLYSDQFIEGLQKFTSMFHQNNTPIGIQLAMGGSQIHYNGEIDWKVMSPSEGTTTYHNKKGETVTIEVEEMTQTDIEDTISDFVAAGKRAKASGFDIVQIHAGHGYFVSQWMNPEKNKRTDEYGTDKTKYVIELYIAMRAALGGDYPIGIKVNSEEQIGDYSNHLPMLELCKQLDQLGIDLIEVSGCSPSRNKIRVENESYFLDFATLLKQNVKTDVVLTGGNKTLSNINDIVNNTNINGIGLSRPLISEPDLIKNWANDNEYKMRCISCNHCHRKTYKCVFEGELHVKS